MQRISVQATVNYSGLNHVLVKRPLSRNVAVHLLHDGRDVHEVGVDLPNLGDERRLDDGRIVFDAVGNSGKDPRLKRGHLGGHDHGQLGLHVRAVGGQQRLAYVLNVALNDVAVGLVMGSILTAAILNVLIGRLQPTRCRR